MEGLIFRFFHVELEGVYSLSLQSSQFVASVAASAFAPGDDIESNDVAGGP